MRNLRFCLQWAYTLEHSSMLWSLSHVFLKKKKLGISDSRILDSLPCIVDLLYNKSSNIMYFQKMLLWLLTSQRVRSTEKSSTDEEWKAPTHKVQTISPDRNKETAALASLWAPKCGRKHHSNLWFIIKDVAAIKNKRLEVVILHITT